MVNYEKWDLSIKDYVIMISFSLGVGFSIGYLFYDSIIVGLGISSMMTVLRDKYSDKKICMRRQELLRQFQDLLYSLSASLSAGRSLAQGLEESIDFWKSVYNENDYIMVELKDMVKRIKECNESELSVLEDFAKRSGLEDVRDFVNVYKNCRDSGGNMILAINRAATIIGDKITLKRELETLTAQKKFEGRIIMAAPFAIMFFLKIVSPDYLLPLTQSLKGMVISTTALSLILIALIMTERINSIEV